MYWIFSLVFINCSGFIKIDTTEMGDSGPDIYIEVLDGSRIHPEHYPWARKMAVDAMCNEDDDVSIYTFFYLILETIFLAGRSK